MNQHSFITLFKNSRFFLWLMSFLMLLFGYWFFARDYAQLGQPIWDEIYHVASAYKYLNGVFYMEPHPPLGKLLIALGEYILSSNELTDLSPLLDHEAASPFPEVFDFSGVRLFPVLFAALTPLLFFHLSWQIFKSRILSVVLVS